MRLVYDPSKSDWNIRERGLSFARAAEFDLPGAVIKVDDRKDYGEIRYVATGYLGNRLHVLCYSEVDVGFRIISFRKANARERRDYENAKTATN